MGARHARQMPCLERKNMEKQARWAADEALVPKPCLRNFGNQQETKATAFYSGTPHQLVFRVTWAHTGELKGKVQACQIKFCIAARLPPGCRSIATNAPSCATRRLREKACASAKLEAMRHCIDERQASSKNDSPARHAMVTRLAAARRKNPHVLLDQQSLHPVLWSAMKLLLGGSCICYFSLESLHSMLMLLKCGPLGREKARCQS